MFTLFFIELNNFKKNILSLTKVKSSSLFSIFISTSTQLIKNGNYKGDICLIISDDLNLPLGKIRYRAKGSSGGHNGLENIEYWLNTNKYSRLRIGISNPQNKINQVDFVLGLFETEEFDILLSNFEMINDSVKSFVLSGISETMNNFNK